MVFLNSRIRYLQVFTLFYRVSAGIILWQSDTFFGAKAKVAEHAYFTKSEKGLLQGLV